MSRDSHFHLTPPIDVSDHVLGEAHAPVSVLEYGDFECPNCKQAAPAVKLLLQRFPGRVRFAFRHFPLEEVHPHALAAAEVAEIAASLGIDPQTVRSTHHKAMLKLREHFADSDTARELK